MILLTSSGANVNSKLDQVVREVTLPVAVAILAIMFTNYIEGTHAHVNKKDKL